MPVVATDPIRGYVYVVSRGGPSELGGTEGLWFMRSTDAGATFSSPMNIGPFNDVEPSMTVDATGAIWIVWSEQTEIVIVNSLDQGMTFTRVASPPLEDVSGDPYIARRNPDIAVDSGGVITVVWSSVVAPDITDIFVSRSSDGGQTFTLPINVSNGNAHSVEPRVAVGTGDSIHIVWGTVVPLGPADSALGPVQYVRSLDGSAFESPMTLLAPDLYGRRPRLAIDAAGAITVVSEGALGSTGTLFVRSTDNGSIFTEPQLIDGLGSLHPDVAVEPDGTIDVVAQAPGPGPLEEPVPLTLGWSKDGGATFYLVTLATIAGDIAMPNGGISETGLPRISTDAEAVHVVWYDAPFAGFDSFYTKRAFATPGPFATLSPASLDFGQVEPGSHTTLTVRVKNSGTAPLSVDVNSFAVTGPDAASFSGPGFASLSGGILPCVDVDWELSPGETCRFSVTYRPSEEGSDNATLTIASNANNSPNLLPLSGTGTPPLPNIQISASSLDFGSVLVGQSASQSFTIHNAGTGDLTLSGFTLSGAHSAEYSLAATGSTCSISTPVAPDGSCTIALNFSPVAANPREAALAIASNDPDTPIFNVSLTGAGTDFALGTQGGGSTSATVTAGGTATFSLQLSPMGFSGTVALACAFQGSTPRGASCAVSPNSVTVNGTDPASFAVNVATTARSIATPQRPALPPIPAPQARQLAPLFLGIMLLLLATKSRKVKGRLCALKGWAPMAVTVLFVVLWAACGGGGGGTPTPLQTGTPAGSYNITVTATVGAVSKTSSLVLKVN